MPFFKDLEELAKHQMELKQRNLDKRKSDTSFQYEKTKEYKPMIDSLNAIPEPITHAIESSYNPINLSLKGLTDSVNKATANIPSITGPSLQTLGHIASKYLKHRDKPTGFELDVNEKHEFVIGGHPVVINGNDLTINGVWYQGTEGLWQLLTQKEPNSSINEDDKKKYLEIIFSSNAHLNASGKPRSGKGRKWREIVGPEYNNRSRTGFGIKFLPHDPNDLEKRLAVLISNLELGHTNVDSNEFHAICDQLLKYGRITTDNYNDFLHKYF